MGDWATVLLATKCPRASEFRRMAVDSVCQTTLWWTRKFLQKLSR